MKKFILILFLLFDALLISASEFQFGQISISPYLAEQNNLSAKSIELLKAKMTEVLLNYDVAAGKSERFIIVANVVIDNAVTTATIPINTTVNLSLHLIIGDGLSGLQFSNYSIRLSGVGSDQNNAIFSALRKFKTTSNDIEHFVRTGVKRIVEYYDYNAPKLIEQARLAYDTQNFEKAIVILTPIPQFCKEYNTALSILLNCGRQIIEQDNNKLLLDAKNCWATNPTAEGAQVANSYISQMITPSRSIIREVEKLNAQIQQTLKQEELRQFELSKLQISTQSDIEKASIQTSASIASSFFSNLPQLIISVLTWF